MFKDDAIYVTSFCSLYFAVSEFARKTGDYATLSAVDIRVLALAYQVTKEETGEEPQYKRANDQVGSGFFECFIASCKVYSKTPIQGSN